MVGKLLLFEVCGEYMTKLLLIIYRSGVASWHVPISEISCLSFLSVLLPSSTTFAEIFVWGMVGLFFVTHLPVW